MEVHIKSGELCERCEHGVERCLAKGPGGEACVQCEMNRAMKVSKSNEHNGFSPSVACGDSSLIRGSLRGKAVLCVCDEIADGIPCEFFQEAFDG